MLKASQPNAAVTALKVWQNGQSSACTQYTVGMEAVIIDCLRTAAGKAPRGSLRNTRPDEMAAVVIRRLLEKYPQVAPDTVEDVILGCAMPEAESGNNMARVVALRAGLPDSVPGFTINRFCSSGLQSIALAADRIRAGGAEILIAGGSESMSLIPMGGNKLAPNPWFVDNRPEIYMNMGLTAEQVQRKYNIPREEQDAFSLRSHQNALRAQAEGKPARGVGFGIRDWRCVRSRGRFARRDRCGRPTQQQRDQ